MISVIIPVYNGENYLAEAIDSVLSQTYRDFEVIIVDDGSQDSTWDIIQSYGDQVRGIRKQNGGVATALNTGIRAARGEYVAWLSHDDRFLPEKLAVQMALLAKYPESAGSYTDFQTISESGEVTATVEVPHYEQGHMLRHLIQSVFINGSTLLIEKSVLEAVGLFDESVRIGNDALMWAAIVTQYNLAHSDQALTQYRIHEVQTSQNAEMMKRDMRIWTRICFERYDLSHFFPELRDGIPNKAQKEMQAYLYLGDVLLYLHLFTGLAGQQYQCAFRRMPSLRNPAFRRLVFLFPYYFLRRSQNLAKRFLRALFMKNPVRPLYPPNENGECSLRIVAERIPDPII